MEPNISIVVAVALNGVIGEGNDLPWHLKDDLGHFKDLTMGHAVIIGHKTSDSIFKRLNGPLPGRLMFVLSRKLKINGFNYCSTDSFGNAITMAKCERPGECFIIGGRSIYEQALPLATRMYYTRVLARPKGDVYFPEYDMSQWDIVSSEFHPADQRNQYPFTIELHIRKE